MTPDQLQRLITGKPTPGDRQAAELLALQSMPHDPDCQTRHVGTVDFPYCSCGLSASIWRVGSKAKR